MCRWSGETRATPPPHEGDSTMTAAAESALLAKVPDRLFIGGEWVESTSGRSIDVHDPATGAVIKTIADASVEDGAAAMDAAAAAQAEWGRTAPRVRGEILRRAFDLLQERA